MKVVQLSTLDGRFGAGIAARRLHDALLAAGVDDDFLTRDRISFSPRVHGPGSGFRKMLGKMVREIDGLPLRFYDRRPGAIVSLNWFPTDIAGRVAAFAPDLVHLHWGQSDFVPVASLADFSCPLVWTLHDMWAFTGGCHYNGDCQGYLTRCGCCPLLRSAQSQDPTRWMWDRKRRVYARLPGWLRLICPSQWLADQARTSPLLEGFPVHVVPNPLNVDVFQPIDSAAARRLFGLPTDRRLLLFGKALGEDERKGLDLLVQALEIDAARTGQEKIGLVTLGPREGRLVGLERFEHWDVGVLQDEVALAALYNAVDVVALPSRQENFSNLLAEALGCGTPCLAFAVGGNGDLIRHQENGYLARPLDPADLAAGLRWILQNPAALDRTRIAAAAAEQLSPRTLIPRFLEIYRLALAR